MRKRRTYIQPQVNQSQRQRPSHECVRQLAITSGPHHPPPRLPLPPPSQSQPPFPLFPLFPPPSSPPSLVNMTYLGIRVRHEQHRLRALHRQVNSWNDRPAGGAEPHHGLRRRRHAPAAYPPDKHHAAIRVHLVRDRGRPEDQAAVRGAHPEWETAAGPPMSSSSTGRKRNRKRPQGSGQHREDVRARCGLCTIGGARKGGGKAPQGEWWTALAGGDARRRAARPMR